MKHTKQSSIAIILIILSAFVISSYISQAQDGGQPDQGNGQPNQGSGQQDQGKRPNQGNMSAPKEDQPKNPSQNPPENQPEQQPTEQQPQQPTEQQPPEKPPSQKHCDDCDDCDDCDYWWLSLASWMDSGSWSNSWSNSDRWEASYYSSQITETPGILVDESESSQYTQSVLSSTGDVQNVLRIVSIDGSINWGSIEMPPYYFARLLMIPSTSGQLNLEEMCPNGEIRYYDLGDVSAGHQYRLWKYSDSEGSHLFRYRIGDDYNYSDTVRIYVD